MLVMTKHTTRQPIIQSADAQVQDYHPLNATDYAATGEDHSQPCSRYSYIHNIAAACQHYGSRCVPGAMPAEVLGGHQ